MGSPGDAMLTNADLTQLTAFRRHLHAHPEVSGAESWTAAQVADALRVLDCPQVVTGLGGHGVAGVWAGAEPGPTVMIRSELDALPIAETGRAEWRSTIPGAGHQCGHDGHSTILLGLARLLSHRPPARGRVVLLFQPAEEDGSGAAAVLADPGFAALRPDWAFALHNFPGLPLGAVALKAGPANCASQGLRVVLTGRTAHASAPHTGVSPGLALARLIPQVMALGPGGEDLDDAFRLVTVCHARLGEPAFGIAPGHGELWLTLRTLHDADMAALRAAVVAAVEAAAAEDGLGLALSTHDDFAACINDAEAVAVLDRAVAACGLARVAGGFPMRASEDFGRFGAVARSAMFLLGSGTDCPVLHAPDYDFPDDLIAPGVRVFEAVLRDLTG